MEITRQLAASGANHVGRTMSSSKQTQPEPLQCKSLAHLTKLTAKFSNSHDNNRCRDGSKRLGQ
jgi:hypothetical protein